MTNLLFGLQMLSVASSSGDSESWIALIAIIPIILIWLVWMFVIFLVWGSAFIFTIGGSILWIFMLVDLVKRDFKTNDEKIVWVVILALTGVIGAIVYYFVVKKGSK